MGWSGPKICAAMVLGLLVACQQDMPDAPSKGPKSSLPLMGGYRDTNDACRRVGEDAFTNQFLDDAADLVACPEGVANLSGLGPETGAKSVGVRGGWVLFSVPRR